MITKELLQRINELAHKKKYSGLTTAELAEQKDLYKIYLSAIREQVALQLENAGIHKKNHQHVCHDGCCEHDQLPKYNHKKH